MGATTTHHRRRNVVRVFLFLLLMAIRMVGVLRPSRHQHSPQSNSGAVSERARHVTTENCEMRLGTSGLIERKLCSVFLKGYSQPVPGMNQSGQRVKEDGLNTVTHDRHACCLPAHKSSSARVSDEPTRW